MKKFVSILSVIAIMFTFIACSEDLYLHNGEDGEDGATGPQGPKGDKGDPGQVELSFVPVPATTEECPSGGYKTEIYINGVLNYTLPAVCNGESLNIEDLNLRTDLLSLDDHCKIRVMYNNDKEFFRDTVCN
ncbi:MAG TPA: collagen-like protein, partial [Candidatus Paceibacterota bacterium]|nr:collagen-like protein [Candidatus Paceibacterota bacterium]